MFNLIIFFAWIQFSKSDKRRRVIVNID